MCPICGYDCASTNEKVMLIHADETSLEIRGEFDVKSHLPATCPETESSSASSSESSDSEVSKDTG